MTPPDHLCYGYGFGIYIQSSIRCSIATSIFLSYCFYFTSWSSFHSSAVFFPCFLSLSFYLYFRLLVLFLSVPSLSPSLSSHTLCSPLSLFPVSFLFLYFLLFSILSGYCINFNSRPTQFGIVSFLSKGN